MWCPPLLLTNDGIQTMRKILAILLSTCIAACGGGGGDDATYAGRWQVKLSPDLTYETGSPRCLRSAQPIDEVITIEQSGTSTVVKFETGDVLMDAGGAFPGRIETDEMISGQTNALVTCPRGYSAQIAQTLIFTCPAGETCNNVARVLVNHCPRSDYEGNNDEIRNSPGCISVWRGTAEKIVQD